MLRQLFRNRGAYNFVNVPAVASQDDPSSNRDPEANWRRQYAYQPPQQEFREDVGCKLLLALALNLKRSLLRPPSFS